MGEEGKEKYGIGDRLTNGRCTRVVHEHQLGMTPFVEAVTPAYAPCGSVLGVWYEAEFDFCDF